MLKQKAPRRAEYCSTPRGDMWATAYARTRGIMAEYGYMLSNFLLSARVGRRPVTLFPAVTCGPKLVAGAGRVGGWVAAFGFISA